MMRNFAEWLKWSTVDGTWSAFNRNGSRGEEKDVNRKISLYLVPWNELTDEVKACDLNYVRNWPEDYFEAGVEIYKL